MMRNKQKRRRLHNSEKGMGVASQQKLWVLLERVALLPVVSYQTWLLLLLLCPAWR